MLLSSHHGSPEHLRNPPLAPPPLKRFQLPVWRRTEAANQTRAAPRQHFRERRASNNGRFYSAGAPNSTRGANANNTDELTRLRGRPQRQRRTQNQPSHHQTPGSDVRPESSGSSSGGGGVTDGVPPSTSPPPARHPRSSGVAPRKKFCCVLVEFLDRTGSFFILTASLKP